MVGSSLVSIRQETSDLNVSKGGSTHLYVDQNASSSSDDNDGFDWDRCFETISAALIKADPWTEIWIKTGIYEESLIVNHEAIKLHGVIQDGSDRVVIMPPSGLPLDLQVGFCEVERMAFVSTAEDAIRATGPGHYLHDLYVEVNSPGAGADYGILLNDCDRAKLGRNYLSGKGGLNDIGILVDGGSVDCEFFDNYLVDWGDVGVTGYAIGVNDAQRCLFRRNVLNSGYVGIYFYLRAGAQLHTVIGNQFYANDLWDVSDNNTDPDVSGIRIINNFYGYTGWYSDNNHDGIANLPIQCNNNYDYAPLSSPHFLTQSFVPRVVA